MTRDCTAEGWKEVDTTYCLPKYHTDENKAYVDFTYRLTYAKFSGFRKSTENFKRAILSAYSTILNDGEVAIYRVSQGSISNSVDIQVRVDMAFEGFWGLPPRARILGKLGLPKGGSCGAAGEKFFWHLLLFGNMIASIESGLA